jgi:hypothetical protein
MRPQFFIRGLSWIFLIIITACGPTPASKWVLLSEDSDGEPTSIDAESVRLGDDGVAIYARVVGDPVAANRVEFLQALDCINLRWAFLTLDEDMLDSLAATSFSTQEWSLLVLNPANQVLLDEVCQDFSPTRWIRVLREDTEEPGNLKEVWVDRESIMGPRRDAVRLELEDLGNSDEVFRSWTRWHDASPDSGYVTVQADVACDLNAIRYLENSRYSKDGELVSQAEPTDVWYPILQISFEAQVFGAVCDMGKFFKPEATPGTSPGGG